MTATKRITRMGALVLLIIFLMSSMATMALAASKTASQEFINSAYGGRTSYVYVKTGNILTGRRVSMNMNAGTLTARTVGGGTGSAEVYDSYTVTVSRWNGKSWVQEQKFDVYNASSKTITMKKANSYYRIAVYSWKVQTLFNSYFNKNVKTKGNVVNFRSELGAAPILVNRAYDEAGDWCNWLWDNKDRPSVKLVPKSKCTMYTSNPKA